MRIVGENNAVTGVAGVDVLLLWFASTAWALSLSQWTPRALSQRQNVRWTRHTLQLVPVTPPLSGASMALVCSTQVLGLISEERWGRGVLEECCRSVRGAWEDCLRSV